MTYFFPASVKVLKEKGIGCLITQNSWMSTVYGRKFQKFVLKNFSITKIIDSDFRFFSERTGPSINTVIVLFDPKIGLSLEMDSLGNVAAKSLYENQIVNKSNKRHKKFTHRDLKETALKWGFLYEAPEWFLELLEDMRTKEVGQYRKGIMIGQGLNISKSESLVAKPHKISSGEMTPFMDKEVCFDLRSTARMVKKPDRRKIPSLILPRGLGRHFCAFNTCGALTASFVEVYLDASVFEQEYSLNL